MKTLFHFHTQNYQENNLHPVSCAPGKLNVGTPLLVLQLGVEFDNAFE